MDEELLFRVPENDAYRVRKEAAVRFLSLIAAGKPKDGLVFFAPDCITHNPYTAGNMDVLTDAMIAVQKQGSGGIVEDSTVDFKLSIKQVLAEDDVVAVHRHYPVPTQVQGGFGRFISSDLKVTRLSSTGISRSSFLKVLLTPLEHFPECASSAY